MLPKFCHGLCLVLKNIVTTSGFLPLLFYHLKLYQFSVVKEKETSIEVIFYWLIFYLFNFTVYQNSKKTSEDLLVHMLLPFFSIWVSFSTGIQESQDSRERVRPFFTRHFFNPIHRHLAIVVPLLPLWKVFCSSSCLSMIL